MLIPHSILTNHTEGHRLNGHDALSRKVKAGLKLGKDSAEVGVKILPAWNHCLLAWELGTLPLDQLDLLVDILKSLLITYNLT